jgi:hypothetical protein
MYDKWEGFKIIGMLFIMIFGLGIYVLSTFIIYRTQYHKNEVVRISNNQLGIISKSELLRIYTIMPIDSEGNTKNTIEIKEKNIKPYRLGE